MAKKEKLKIEKLTMLVELNNGAIHQLLITKDYKDVYLTIIAQYEGGIKLIEEPLCGVEIITCCSYV